MSYCGNCGNSHYGCTCEQSYYCTRCGDVFAFDCYLNKCKPEQKAHKPKYHER